jgi:hypothetical protein
MSDTAVTISMLAEPPFPLTQNIQAHDILLANNHAYQDEDNLCNKTDARIKLRHISFYLMHTY